MLCFPKVQGQFVKSWVSITNGQCEIWFHIWKLSNEIQSTCTIPLVCNLMIGCPKKSMVNYFKRLLNKGLNIPWLKFNPGLALISLQTTGPRTEQVSIQLSCNFNKKKLWSFLHQQFQAKLQHLQSALHQEGNHQYMESNLT